MQVVYAYPAKRDRLWQVWQKHLLLIRRLADARRHSGNGNTL
jgi:hypothetical protein